MILLIFINYDYFFNIIIGLYILKLKYIDYLSLLKLHSFGHFRFNKKIILETSKAKSKIMVFKESERVF